MALELPARAGKLGEYFSSDAALPRAFRGGLATGACFFALLFIWMWLRGPYTAEKIQTLLPFTSVALTEPQARIEDEQSARPLSAPPEGKSESDPDDTLLSGRKIKDPLPAAPLEGLYESASGKTLPIVRISDDLTPFSAYKKPHTALEGRPQISIVLTDFGLSEQRSRMVLNSLPAEVTLVLSPYAAQAAQWAASARAFGHEYWVQLAMQVDKDALVDSGPAMLGANVPIDENLSRLLTILGKSAGYAGVVTAKNHSLMDADLAAAPALRQIFGRGLALAESNPERPAWGLSYAMEQAYPYVQNNFWLDENLQDESLGRAFRALERQAALKGKAVAFLHPYPALIEKLVEWAGQAEEKGFQLAPLSAVVSQ
ncbi:MAG: divergent polysaccharide deacetylase family protein [Micavibrio sp.]